MLIEQSGMDVAPGCEGAADAMISWLDAVETGDIDRLDGLFDDRMSITCDSMAAGGRFTKAQLIEFDRHIRECRVEVLRLTARKCEDAIITQVFAKVQERFEGDLGPRHAQN